MMRAAIAPVGHVPAEEGQREGRDGLDQAKPAQRQRIAGELVDLVAHDRGERAAGEGVRAARPQQRPELGQAKDVDRGRRRTHRELPVSR